MNEIIVFHADSVPMPDIDPGTIRQWVALVAESYGRKCAPINYIFCNDERIITVNRQFLQHDYYTDIITFDYSHGTRISGDLFISLETVLSNSEMQQVSYEEELHRVIIHGILHLCGINDKGPGEREIMEAAENRALAMLHHLRANQ